MSGAHDECGMCTVEDDDDLDGARDGGEGTSGAVDGGAAQSMDEQMSGVIDGGAPMSVDEQMSGMGAGGSGGGTLQGAIVKKKRKHKNAKPSWARRDAAAAKQGR